MTPNTSATNNVPSMGESVAPSLVPTPDATDLAAEALVVTVGLFPDALTPADAREARDLPKSWYDRMCEFMRSDRPGRFRMMAQPDAEKLSRRLLEPVDVEELAGGLEDAALVSAFASKLEEVRRYVAQLFPVLHVEHLTGVDYVEPSLSASGAAYSVMALCGKRDHLCDEIAAGTLTADQAEAFKALFPGLFGMVQEFLRYERAKMMRAKDRAAFHVEVTLRTLLGLPPDARAMTSPADEPPASNLAPAPSMPSLDIDFASGYSTRAQQVDAPDA